jgi:hypothetical protein
LNIGWGGHNNVQESDLFSHNESWTKKGCSTTSVRDNKLYTMAMQTNMVGSC